MTATPPVEGLDAASLAESLPRLHRADALRLDQQRPDAATAGSVESRNGGMDRGGPTGEHALWWGGHSPPRPEVSGDAAGSGVALRASEERGSDLRQRRPRNGSAAPDRAATDVGVPALPAGRRRVDEPAASYWELIPED